MSQEKTKKHQYFIVGAALSIPAFIYCLLCVAYYVWLTVVEPDRWPMDKSIIFIAAFGSFATLLLVTFIVCVLQIKKLKRE